MKVYRVELKASGIKFRTRVLDRDVQDMIELSLALDSKFDIPPGTPTKTTVERFTNLGPYCGTSSLPANICGWLREKGGLVVNPRFDYDEDQHPDPYDDRLLRANIKKRRDFTGSLSSLFYGFTSVESLDAWFDFDIRRKLHDAGYVVMVYEAEEAYEGTAQAVFNIETATPVNIIHLHEFPKESYLWSN